MLIYGGEYTHSSCDATHTVLFFRFLTYLALKLFVEAKLDVVVLEVGLGGRLDSTNVIPTPVATAVTTLDYDHVELLGDTLAKIAREKAGIFRENVPAYTCLQEVEAMGSLQTVAKEVCFMHVVSTSLPTCCPYSYTIVQALFFELEGDV